MKKVLAIFALFCAAACEQQYKTVQIGSQTWMAENLSYNAKGSLCQSGEPANCNKYGRLYNWETAKTVCPKGWHLPANEEWETLFSFLGGKREVYIGDEYESDGRDIPFYTGVEKKLKAKDGFAALLGGGFTQGDYDESHIEYGSAGDYGCWFSASPGYSAGEIWYIGEGENGNDEARTKFLEYKEGCSVRCVKD